LTWNAGDLADGSSYTATVTVTVLANGNYINTATSSSTTPDSNPDNNEGTPTQTVITTPQADLSVTKSVSNTTPKVGDQITFTIVATNNGPSTASDVTITDVLPSGYSYVSSTPLASVSGSTLTWNAGDLADGSSYTATVTVTVLANGNYINTATVSSTTPDSNPDNNEGTPTETITTTQEADLSIVKVVSSSDAQVGATIEFTITVTNNGSSDATGVFVTDELPTGYAYLNSTASMGSYDSTTGKWTIGSIENGSSEALVVTVKVNSTGNYVNTATVSGTVVDPVTSNNTATATINAISSLVIPEIFTPNGDGIQDKFKITGLDNYPDATIYIYNRWGNLVYQQEHYGNTDLLGDDAWWDGTVKEHGSLGTLGSGKKLVSATYYYILDLKDGSTAKTGPIFLMSDK
jgi:large repetitive protein